MKPKPQVPQSSALSPQSPLKPWTPTWTWHLKALAGIYFFLAVFYFAANAFLSRLPAPYGLRDIPPELTPWLKR